MDHMPILGTCVGIRYGWNTCCFAATEERTMKGFFKDRTRIVILVCTMLIAVLTTIDTLKDNEVGVFASVGEWVRWVRLAIWLILVLVVLVMMGIQARNNDKKTD